MQTDAEYKAALDAHEAQVSKVREEQAVIKARYERLQAEIAEAKREAAKRIQDEYAEQTAAAQAEFRAAHDALRAVEDQTPKHPWEGRKVYRLEDTARSRLSRTKVPQYKRIDGVVETVTSATVFPGNTAYYNKPRRGSIIVRLLKGDGTPGVKFERFHHNHAKWELADFNGLAKPTIVFSGPRR